MNAISRYIFNQVSGPLIFFTFVFTGVVWLSQSLRMLDIIINQGQTALIYLYLTALSLPGLISLILPFALFCAVLYALNRLYLESELIVIWAAGYSRWAVAWPVFVIAILTMMLGYLLNLVLMPSGMREVKDRVFEIRADLVNTFIREGAFTTPIEGLTVYVGERGGGEIRGILVHDARKPKSVATYMAQRGLLASTPEGPRLIMFNGNVQWVEGVESRLKILNFDKYTFDIGQFDKQRTESSREASERYLSELFEPGAKTSDKDRRKFFGEAHERLSSPLYSLIFALIGVLAVAGGTFNRKGYGGRVAIAILAVLAARLPGFGLLSVVRSAPELWPVMYLWPALWLIALYYFLSSARLQLWSPPAGAAQPA
jgi:lipopolysaccharide export system permease protein